MKPSLKIAMHLCIGVVAFFGLFTSGKTIVTAKSAAPSETLPRKPEARNAAAKTDRPGRSMTAEEYKSAWDAIPTKRWGRKERFDWQIKLLKEWAVKDLEGALRAAFSESWSRNQVTLVKGEAFKFHGAFVDSIRNRPQDVLKLIQEKKLGILESSILLHAWSVTMFQNDPQLYLSYVREFKGADFPLALNASFEQAEDINTLTQALDLAEEKARQGISMEGLATWAMTNAAMDLTKDELLDRMTTPDPTLRDYYVFAMAAREMKSGRQSGPDEVLEEIQRIPADKRGHFAELLLMFSGGKPGVIQASLDHFLGEGDWKALERINASRAVGKMAEKADPAAVAEWVATLPPREETNGMFQNGVEPFIRKSPEDAWNWIQNMEQGYWRDRALAEYSQVNLTVFADPGKSATALGQIRDPEVLKAAQDRRREWEAGQKK